MDNILKIESKRLLLRTINLDDSKAYFQYHSDSYTNRYQGWIPNSLAETQDFIKTRISREFGIYNTWYQLMVLRKEDNKIIGDIGIHFFDKNEKQVELGITIDKKFHDNGYASESLSTIINFVFFKLDKHRIVNSVDPNNKGAINLCKRLGFRKEAHFKKSLFLKNKWVDDVIYAILKEEWISLKGNINELLYTN